MSIDNPFDRVENKVYKNTFLRSVEVNILFASGSVSAEDYWRDVTKFLNSYFPSVGSPKIESDLIGSLKLVSANKQLEFTFVDGSVSLRIAHEFYKSFTDTLVPALRVLTAYIHNVVHLEAVQNFSLFKENIWPIRAEDDSEDYREVISFIFNEDIAKGFASTENLKIREGQSFRLSRETELSLGENAKLFGKLLVDFQNFKEYNILLKCRTEAYNVPLSDIISVATELNDVQFDFYHEMVSDSIIEIMEKGEN